MKNAHLNAHLRSWTQQFLLEKKSAVVFLLIIFCMTFVENNKKMKINDKRQECRNC